ncbi:hypothetical protein H4R24_004973 [Coemansia sp. RSA 988]|nr:hypothetical protein H4R24_004973 [Coemansia sp. RSA 988]
MSASTTQTESPKSTMLKIDEHGETVFIPLHDTEHVEDSVIAKYIARSLEHIVEANVTLTEHKNENWDNANIDPYKVDVKIRGLNVEIINFEVSPNDLKNQECKTISSAAEDIRDLLKQANRTYLSFEEKNLDIWCGDDEQDRKSVRSAVVEHICAELASAFESLKEENSK